MAYEFRAEETMEQLEQLEEMERNRQLEQDPPKLERQEMVEISGENPPKLERTGTKLGGYVTQMMIEQNELRRQHLLEQNIMNASGEGFDTQEYWQSKLDKLEADRDTRQRIWSQNSFEVNYGTPTTEEGWQEEAAREYIKWGKETAYYTHCMNEAAKAHVKGK